MQKKVKSIEARSLVASRDREPAIDLVLKYDDGTEKHLAQLTPEQARHHAMAVLGAAEAAEQDSFLVHFIQETLGQPFEAAGTILIAFRMWRQDRERKNIV